jgi:hypothetical protein
MARAWSCSTPKKSSRTHLDDGFSSGFSDDEMTRPSPLLCLLLGGALQVRCAKCTKPGGENKHTPHFVSTLVVATFIHLFLCCIDAERPRKGLRSEGGPQTVDSGEGPLYKASTTTLKYAAPFVQWGGLFVGCARMLCYGQLVRGRRAISNMTKHRH